MHVKEVKVRCKWKIKKGKKTEASREELYLSTSKGKQNFGII